MQLKSTGFLLNRIDNYNAKNQNVNKKADSFSDEYENIDYNENEEQFDTSEIVSLKSKLENVNTQKNDIQNEINDLKEERKSVNEELEKYADNTNEGNIFNYNRINEYDEKSVLEEKKRTLDSKIHTYLSEIEELNKEEITLTTELNKRKYLSYGEDLTSDELNELSKLAMYAPWLFDPTKMNYKKYNGYEWDYDYNGYDNYEELLKALENNGLSTEDIDNSLPNGEKIDWIKVKSAYSKGVTNLDIGLQLEFNGNSGSKVFTAYVPNEFLSRIAYMHDSEIEEAYSAYTNNGLDGLNEYLESINPEINQREGMIKALQFLSTVDLDDPNYQDYIKTHFKGLEDGLEQFGHGMEVFLSPMSELSRDITADQYEAMYIATMLGQSNSNVDLGLLGEFNALEKVYTLSMAEGNMLPSMVAGTLGSAFGLEGLGAFTMFCSVTGTSAENTYQQGYDLYSSWFYGALSGASESGLEYLLGGIPGISKIADKSFLTRIFSEGVEESLQEILDPYLKYLATGEEPEINWENVLEAGIDGMILAAYLNGGEVIINNVTISTDFLQSNYNIIKELEAKGIDIDYSRLTEEGYIESLQDDNSSVVKSEEYNENFQTENTFKNEAHTKLLEMSPEQLHDSIQLEINSFDPNSSDYSLKVEMLLLKEELELELIEKFSVQKENGVTPTKSTDSLTVEQQEQVKVAAREVRSYAETVEPKVTAIMESLVDSQTRLEGLDFKLKSENSIQDKIARKIDQGKTIEEAKKSIHDSVRYTLIVSGEYETTVLQKLSMLKDQGYEVVDMNNAWGKDQYQGLNVNLKNSDGLYVELQFHTEESFYVKEHLNHELYELSRNITTSEEIREISNQIQALNQATYVGSDTTFRFTSPQELNMAVSNYYGDIEQRIITRMPKNLNSIEQAKFVYNSLNELMEYSTSYYFGSNEEKRNIFNQHIDINNVESNQIICDTWAVMFSECLNNIGISSKVMGKSHKWVIIEFDDGSKWVADPTQPYNKITDLANAKLGIESGGFFQVTDEMAASDTLLVGGYNFRNAKSMSTEIFRNQDLIKKIDMKIGYDYKFVSELFSISKNEPLELNTLILGVSADATDGEIAAAKFEKVILPNLQKLKGIEGLSYYTAMKSILTQSESNLISYSISPLDNGRYDIVFTIDLENGKIINYIYSPDGTVKKETNGVII